MKILTVLVFSASLITVYAAEISFPTWFKFGASTSAYQVEGAWNASDKAESIWDRFVHSSQAVTDDFSSGDVACNSYELWRRDVEMAKELGLQTYRFSIAWTRLLPTGFANQISDTGKKYYNDLIDALLENNIEPIVTLQHFDIPQILQDLGGWANPEITNWFRSYASVVFSLYADRVKYWITINEPLVMCDIGYITGTLAPGVIERVVAPYLCIKNMMIAHAKAWRLYDEQYKSLYHGKMSLSNEMVWYYPKTIQDEPLARLVRDYMGGLYSHPIYSKAGGWPPAIVKVMKDVSFKEGFDSTRLPIFTKEEINLVRGTYDFFGINYYACRLVRRAKPGEQTDPNFISGVPIFKVVVENDPNLKTGPSDQVFCPKGLRDQIAWIKDQYGDMEVLITENGYSSLDKHLKDYEREDFIRDHLEQVLLAIKIDKVNITGYTYWSLMDNFEWSRGYIPRFGLYHVDFNSPKLTRTPRQSASYYSNIIRNNAIRLEPNSTYLQLDDKTNNNDK